MKGGQKSKEKQKSKQQEKKEALVLKNKVKAKKKEEFKRVLKWASTIAQNPNHYSNQQQHTNHHYYRITFLQLNDLDIPQAKRNQFIQYSFILYSKAKQTYVGSTFSTEMFQIGQNDRRNLQSNKTVYLYTHLEDLCLKVDVWRMECEKNGKGQESMVKRNFIGSLEINVGKDAGTGVFEKDLDTREGDKFFSKAQEMAQNKQEIDKLKRKVLMQYHVINTHSLSYLHHFVPENCIVDQFSQILGLKTKFGTSGELIVDERYKLRIAISEVNVPHQMMQMALDNTQQGITSQYNVIGKPKTNVRQFRLHLCFQNGHKQVSHQSLVLRDSKNESNVLDNKDNMANSKYQKTTKPIQSSKVIQTEKIIQSSKFIQSSKKMTVKNKISQHFHVDTVKELKAVFLGTGGVLIVWIEVKIECKFDYMEQQKKSKNETVNVPLAFSISLLKDVVDENFMEKLTLTYGNPFYLKDLSKYLSQLKGKVEKEIDEGVHIDQCYCIFESLLKKSEGSIDNIESIEKDMNQIQTLKVEKERLARIKRKIKEEKRKRLIELNQEIPFLDTIQLKEQLYQQKLANIRTEKQEKEDILFYLKSKITTIQRSKMTYRQEDQPDNSDDESQDYLHKLKLDPNFIDFQLKKPEPDNASSHLTLDCFSNEWQRIQQPVKTVSTQMVRSLMGQQTYLSFKVINFDPFYSESEQFTLVIQESDGMRKEMMMKQIDFERKEITVKVIQAYDTEPVILNTLNALLNGYFPIYLYPHNNKRFTACCLLDLSHFINKSDHQYIFNENKNVKAAFKINQTILANLEFNVAFTRTIQQQQSLAEKVNDNPLEQIVELALLNPKENTILSRINRFKKERGIIDKRLQVVQKGVNVVHKEILRVRCNGLKQEPIYIKIMNSDPKLKKFRMFMSGDDHLELTRVNKIVINGLELLIQDGSFELNGHEEGRLIIVFDQFKASMKRQKGSLQSKREGITTVYHLNIAEATSQVITHSFELHLQAHQYLTFQHTFLIPQHVRTIDIPIPTSTLQIQSYPQSISTTANKFTFSLPHLKNNEKLNERIVIKKERENMATDLIRMQLCCLGCQKMQIDGRLWQTKDILIKIPIEVILERQSQLQFLIETMNVHSESIHLKIKRMDGYVYSSQMAINRKNNQIYIRAKLQLQDVGTHIYGVEICDKNDLCFHRIGITTKVQYPFISPSQIITLKIPSTELDHPEPFLYQNKSDKAQEFIARSYRPDLIDFKQHNGKFLKVGEEWILQMNMRWQRMLQMLGSDNEQINILIGLVGTWTIDYIILRCK